MATNKETEEVLKKISDNCGLLVGYEDLDPHIPKFLQSVDKVFYGISRGWFYSLPYLEQKAEVAKLLVKKVRG